MNLHKTRDGKVMFISSMTDEHLINTVKVFLSHLKSTIDIISLPKKENNIDMILSGYDYENMVDGAKDNLKQIVEKLSEYTIELLIRGINMQKEFSESFGRNTMEILELPQVVDMDEIDF